MSGIFEKIWRITKSIPMGRVMTYGGVASLIGTSPRVVGWALSMNHDLAVPCHRVVDKDGYLHGFNRGLEEKRRLLEQENIKVKNFRIDLDKYLWRVRSGVC